MTGFVYFATPENGSHPIKIGCSRDIEKRLDTLSAWAPYPMTLLVAIKAGYREEAALHARFAKHLIHREWFRPAPEIFALIDRLKSGDDLADLIDISARRKNPRRKWTADARLRHSYRLRLSYTERRFWKKRGEIANWSSDIETIMNRWGGNWGHARRSPSNDEMRTLDEALSNPAKHMRVRRYTAPQLGAAS